jgi:hypothetical protein
MREEVIDRGDQDDLLHDLTIVTDNAGVVGVMRPGSPAIGESFTTDEGEIVEANRALTTLSPYQREVVEIFPGLFEA